MRTLRISVASALNDLHANLTQSTQRYAEDTEVIGEVKEVGANDLTQWLRKETPHRKQRWGVSVRTYYVTD